MLAQLQRVEVEPAFVATDELTVEHDAFRELLEQRLAQLGEVAQERLLLRLCRSRSSPSRNTTQRKPSHFGS